MNVFYPSSGEIGPIDEIVYQRLVLYTGFVSAAGKPSHIYSSTFYRSRVRLYPQIYRSVSYVDVFVIPMSEIQVASVYLSVDRLCRRNICGLSVGRSGRIHKLAHRLVMP